MTDSVDKLDLNEPQSSRVDPDQSTIDPSSTEEEEPIILTTDIDEDAEIESARESVMREQEESEEDDDEAEEEVEIENNAPVRFNERVIMSVAGSTGRQFDNLKTRLTGKIVVSITDDAEGYLFEWIDDKLSIEKWSGHRPDNFTTLVEIGAKDLEQILRGRLNPQVAMLSHKVHVQGEASQAVYLFNLFVSQR